MKLTHELPEKSISKEGCPNPISILSSNNGSFFYISEEPLTKYNGFFLNYDMKMFKTIENIRIVNHKIAEVENHLNRVIRRYKYGNADKTECFHKINGFKYSLNQKDVVEIDFDCRRMNDLRSFGQNYTVSRDNNNIIVEFIKKTDSKEDGTEGEEELKLYTAIHTIGSSDKDMKVMDKWVEHVYDYDASREDFPVDRYVYQPFRLKCKKLLVGFGQTKEEAQAEVEKLKHARSKEHNIHQIDTDICEHKAAFICAQHSLDQLKVVYENITRLYAGFPWFYQFWSRDECISVGALIKLKQFKEMKANLMNYLGNILPDGRLPNHIPNPHLGSADGIGWFWKRMYDLINTAEDENKIEKIFSKEDVKKITSTLQTSIEHIENNFMHDGLITNNTNETWMDTTVDGNDPRDGARIEIQALHLIMLNLLHKLSGEKKWQDKEQQMISDVRNHFWKDGLLLDGRNDHTIRPNIFLACYIYEGILSKEEWSACFNKTLEALWLDWGGLTTIDKNHYLFVDHYTGRNDRSYHRGDSWFFVNNFAALCMYRIDKLKFKKHIDKIINASTKELLWMGAPGHAAEVSGANKLESKGCFAQTWSAASYVELMLELYKTR